MSFQQFPVRFGKYIILDRISAGGMAEVYRAKEMRDDGFSPVIAIKRMLPGIASEAAFAPMFVDEAKLASSLSHANIAQTLELGRVGESLYIAMEMVWGRDLKSIMKACAKRKLPVPLSFACYVVAKAAEALDFAHNAHGPDGRALKLVHRDVSPHNLMIDFEGAVKVIDFGVAKADINSSQTVHGTIKGKFSYMAPEQVTGAPVDGRTDIFGLGIVLYEALSGERLYDGSSAFSIFDKVVNQPAPRLADIVPGVSPELDAIVARCLQKRREDRYDNAAQLADALTPFLIHDRTIVGPREAAKFLRELFPDDQNDMRERLRLYETVTERDCIDSREDVVRPSSEDAHTRVYAQSPAVPTELQPSLAAPADDTPPASLALQRRGTDEIDRPRPGRMFAITVTMLLLGIAVAGGILYQNIMQTPADVAVVQTPRPPPPPAAITATELPKVPAVGSSFSLSAPDHPPDETLPPPTVQHRPPTTTVQHPPPTTTVERPAPTTTVEHPALTTTVEHPAPTTTVQHPPPTTTVQRPPPAAQQAKAGPRSKAKVAHAPKPPPVPAPPPGDIGFLSVGAKGAAAAKVFIDGREIGYAPVVAHKVKLGKHVVKVVPVNDELPGTPNVQTVEVAKDNVQGSPKRVFAEFK